MNLKKVTIIGPGALGILFAAGIWQKFKGLCLLHHDENKAMGLEAHGIEVVKAKNGGKMVAFPKVTASSRDLGTQDVVLVLVKTYQTTTVIDSLKDLCGKKTAVITLQNGIGSADILETVVPRSNLILGVTMHGANRVEENTVVHAGKGQTFLGMVDSDAEPLETAVEFAKLLNRCGFETNFVKDIYPIIWKKLLVNVGINALTALTMLRNGQILKYSNLTKIQEMAVREAYNVMQKKGIDVGLDLKGVYDLVRKVSMDTAENISSMLQDRLKKTRTEIDFINGAIVRIGRELGIETPVNETLYALVDFWGYGHWEQAEPR